MHINEFDYHLPEELIAQYPADKRENARLMVVNRKAGTIEHKHFYDIVDYLNPGDCLVMNNSKVIPARIFGHKMTGGAEGAKVEILLIKRVEGDLWQCMVRPGKKLHIGDTVILGEGQLTGVIKEYSDDGTRIIEFQYERAGSGDRSKIEFLEILEKVGKLPLPPYIERDNELEDKNRYQTVYCKEEGSVAAPTAGLHFTEEILAKAKEKGVKLAFVTLHVGIGTFRPVKVDHIEDHHMHFEEYEIDEENAEIINDTKEKGGRIVCVGTTSSRTLESATTAGKLQAGAGSTDIFINPGYEFKIVDALITNFHLPKSTLLMLISALYDREKILGIYEEAIKEKYRFFSYGDAMMLV